MKFKTSAVLTNIIYNLLAQARSLNHKNAKEWLTYLFFFSLSKKQWMTNELIATND